VEQLGCVTLAWSEETTRTAESTSCGVATGGEDAEGVAEVVGYLPSLVVTSDDNLTPAVVTIDDGDGGGDVGGEESFCMEDTSEAMGTAVGVLLVEILSLPWRSCSADVFASKLVVLLIYPRLHPLEQLSEGADLVLHSHQLAAIGEIPPRIDSSEYQMSGTQIDSTQKLRFTATTKLLSGTLWKVLDTTAK
jgi:hypothetical protein